VAFPTAALSSGATATEEASHTITVPAVTAGDRLIAVAIADQDKTFGWPANWTQVLAWANAGTSSGISGEIYYRDIDGTEGWGAGGSFVLTTSAAERIQVVIVKLDAGTFHTGSPPAPSTWRLESSSLVADPPGVDPTGWDTEDTLWIAVGATDDGTKTLSSYPTNYTVDQITASSGVSGGVVLAVATRELNASTESPGAFTFSGSNDATMAATVAIRPAGVPAGAGYYDEVLTDNPVVLLKMDDASGALVDTQVGNNATVSGSTPTYQVAGPATGIPFGFRFVSGTLATIADSADVDLGDGPWSIEFWLRRDAAAAAYQMLRKRDGTTTPGYAIVWSSANLLLLQNGAGSNNIRTTDPDTDLGWHHWVFTRGAGVSGQVFRDAVDVTTESAARTFSDNALALVLGNDLSGDMAGFAIYKTQLDAASVAAHYAARSSSSTDSSRADTQTVAEGQTILGTGSPDETLTITETAIVTSSSADVALVTSDSILASESSQATGVGAAVASVPDVVARVDWWDRGGFTDPLDDITDYILSDHLTRGRSTDYGTDAIGSRTFRLRNDTGRFTPDRNWHDNPSFEVDTSGWSVAAIAGLIAAGTSIAKVVDNAPSAGSAAGEAVLQATLNAGVAYAIPHTFRAGVAYQVEIYLKSVSGSTSIEAGIGSSAAPTDRAISSGAITGSWAAKSLTWTPTADRDDVVVFVRTGAASAATVRIDRVQVNPGSLNGYLEAPTKGQLAPGRRVHLYATWLGIDYPLNEGRIERISPIPLTHDVEFVCYDQLRRFQETDVVVPAMDFVQRSARDFRREILEDFERGTRNLVGNPSFEVDTAGWNVTSFGGGGPTLTRIATDAAVGSACGEYVAAQVNNRLTYPVRLAPIVFDGQTYRLSLYLRTTGTEADWAIGLFASSSLVFAERTIRVTAGWVRHTLTWTVPTTVTASNTTPLTLYIRALAGGTVRVDGVAVTRGQALHPYEDSGSGRWPNWCGNGSFDGLVLNGWYDGFLNLVGNPSFEVDTAGWSAAADAFHTAATSIARSTAQQKYGAASGLVTPSSGQSGVHYAITGTFKAGLTYDVVVSARSVTGVGGTFQVGIGSNGTPTDKGTANSPGGLGLTWIDVRASWTPSADRTDVHVFTTGFGSNYYIDGIMVTRRDLFASAGPNRYSDVGPGVGGSFTSARSISSTARWGSRSHQADTPATATAGRIYDFGHLGSYFQAGQPYTLSIWIRPTSSMPYKVGIGGNKADGTWDEASTTGTASANAWTQVTVTWTPSADRSAAGLLDAVLFVYQTDATARTFLIDGVRVIPGSSADAFEMDHWSLGDEDVVFSPSASLTGSALGALQQLNKLTLTRHYVRPTMPSPFYAYVAASRDDLATKTSVETIIDTGVGGLEDLSPWQLDRAAIINIVPVSFSGGIEYMSDAASIRTYGARPGLAINGVSFYSERTPAEEVGAALVARYKVPRARPQLRRSNIFPNMLARQVDDRITVSAARLKVASQPYLIVIWELDIEQAGLVWRARYGLEEVP
jgi:hypothetical protein